MDGQRVDEAKESLQQMEGLPKEVMAIAKAARTPPVTKGPEVQALLSDLQEVEGTAETLQSKAAGQPKIAGPAEQAGEEVRTLRARARKMLPPPLTPVPEAELTKIADGFEKQIALARELVATPPPPPPPPPPPKFKPPFTPAESTMIIAASSDLGSSLVVPLLKAHAAGEVVGEPEPTRVWYYTSGKEKILVRVAAGAPCLELLDGKADLVLSDVGFSPEELQAFGRAFPGKSLESRAQSELVAMDALTLLAHPSAAKDELTASEVAATRWLSGPPGSPEHAAAMRLGFQVAKTTDHPAEAVLQSTDQYGLSLYHKDHDNIRAKRLAYKASAEATALKPSPFTIATEDYKFAFRVVATFSQVPGWRHPLGDVHDHDGGAGYCREARIRRSRFASLARDSRSREARDPRPDVGAQVGHGGLPPADQLPLRHQ